MLPARSTLFALATAALCLNAPAMAQPVKPVRVIASFSILGDFVSQVGGDRVEVTTLVGPNSDAHVYAPTPADAGSFGTADLVVVNGLGFEGWLDRLVEATGYSGPVAIATQRVEPLMRHEGHPEEAGHANEAAPEHAGEAAHRHDHGDVDPHAWQSVANARIYVANVKAALCAVAPGDCETFSANASRYDAELAELDAAVKSSLADIPADKRKVITSHDAFGYFSAAYGIRFLAPQGVGTEAEASATDVAALIDQVRAEGVTALFVENISDPRLIEQIARETGAAPGGALYSDALSDAAGPAPTYVDMTRHNANLLRSAMLGS